MIVDRNNEPLAISTPVESVAASPADVDITPEQVRRLARLLEVESRRAAPEAGGPEARVRLPQAAAAAGGRRARRRPRHPRGVPAARVPPLLPGGRSDGAPDRHSPTSTARARKRSSSRSTRTLAGRAGSRRVIKDRLGHIVEDVESIRAPQDGRTLALSIDARIQYLAYRELKAAVAAHRARAGGIVVLDVSTGEVLAMANVPSFNPNNRGKFDPRRTRNRAVTDLFEPGSTLKPFTAAAALEAGTVRPDSVIQTAPGQLAIGNRMIHDAHPQGALTVAQVIQKSSNVGAAKMALGLKPETLWSLFHQVGFGVPPRSGFPGEVVGEAARARELAADRAGHDVLRPRHLGVAAAARARLSHFRDRRGTQAGNAGQARSSRRRRRGSSRRRRRRRCAGCWRWRCSRAAPRRARR